MVSRRWVGVGLAALVAAGLGGCGSGGGSAPAAGAGLARLEVTPASLTVAAGSSTPLAVQGRTTDGRPVGVTGVTWTVSGPVGAISPEGVFTATTSTSSETPAAGTVTVSAEGLTAVVQVAVLPGALARLTVEPTAAVDLASLAPGDVVSFQAVGEDEYGNRGRSHRFPVTPTWTLEGDVGAIDAAGRFVAMSDGDGRVVATFGEQRAHLDLAVVLPAGVMEAAGVVLQPGQSQTVTTEAGFVFTSDNAVDVPTTVVVEVVGTPSSGLTQADQVSYDSQSARVSVPSGELVRLASMAVPGQTPRNGLASSPVVFVRDGDNSFPVVYAPPAEGVTYLPPALSTGASARQSSAGHWEVTRAEVPIPELTYQLGPLGSYSADHDFNGLSEGYGANGARAGSGWPRAGRVAVVVHGMASAPGKFKDATGFADFLQAAPQVGSTSDGGLGYDAIWAFQYDWTKHIAENGRILGELLSRAMTDQPGPEVDLFCHSMGGLVVRHMLEVERPANVRISRLVTLGTPHQGSVLAGQVEGSGGGSWRGARQTYQPFIDPVCFMTDDLSALIVAAHQVGHGAAQRIENEAFTAGLGLDGVADLAVDSAFLRELNRAPAADQRVRPIYFAIAGVVGDDYLHAAAWVEILYDAAWLLPGVTTDDARDLITHGDGVVHQASAHWPGLDLEAGAFDGLLRNQIAVREAVIGVDHLNLTADDRVRGVLRRWWNASDVDVDQPNGSVTIH